MPGIVRYSANTVWPVSLAEAKGWLKINVSSDDSVINLLIAAATVYLENNTGLTLASRDFIQSLDSFPFYPYSREPYGTLYGIGALSLYFGYGPISPTPFPPFGISNGSKLPFQIDLLTSPVTKVDRIEFVGSDGQAQVILPGRDFIADLMSTPARITPLPGAVWPQCTIGPNNVKIFLTAGLQNYDPFASPPDSPPFVDETAGSPPSPPLQLIEQKYLNALPDDLKVGIMMMLYHLYFNRDTVVSGNAVTIPHGLDSIIGLNKVYDHTIGQR